VNTEYPVFLPRHELEDPILVLEDHELITPLRPTHHLYITWNLDTVSEEEVTHLTLHYMDMRSGSSWGDHPHPTSWGDPPPSTRLSRA